MKADFTLIDTLIFSGSGAIYVDCFGTITTTATHMVIQTKNHELEICVQDEHPSPSKSPLLQSHQGRIILPSSKSPLLQSHQGRIILPSSKYQLSPQRTALANIRCLQAVSVTFERGFWCRFVDPSSYLTFCLNDSSEIITKQLPIGDGSIYIETRDNALFKQSVNTFHVIHDITIIASQASVVGLRGVYQATFDIKAYHDAIVVVGGAIKQVNAKLKGKSSLTISCLKGKKCAVTTTTPTTKCHCKYHASMRTMFHS